MEDARKHNLEQSGKSSTIYSPQINGQSSGHAHGTNGGCCSSHACHSHSAPKQPSTTQLSSNATCHEHSDLDDKQRSSSSSSAATSHSNEESQDSQSCECCYCDKNNSKSPATRKLAAKKRLQALLQEKYRDQQQELSDRLGSISLKEKSVPSRTISNDSMSSSCPDVEEKNIDELLGFIEGHPLPNPKKVAKKARQRQKKLEEQLAEEERLKKLEQNEKRKKKELKKLQRKQQAQAKAGKPLQHNAGKSTTSSSTTTTNPKQAKQSSSAPPVPNGMVRITHNPLTNSAIITPLYGPIETASTPPSYFNPTLFNGMVSVPTPSPRLPMPQFPKPSVAFSRSQPGPGLGDQQRSYHVVNNAPVPKPPSEIPKMLNKNGFVEITGNKAPDQPMVTIRRVNDSRNDPVVTITLKGERPEADKVLFTLVNGQALGSDKSDPKSDDPKPSKAELKKELKKQKKKEKKKSYKEENEKLHPVERKIPNPSPQPKLERHITQVNETDVILENFKLPPGITVTRVHAPPSNTGIAASSYRVHSAPSTTASEFHHAHTTNRYFPAINPVLGAGANYAASGANSQMPSYRYPFPSQVNSHMSPSVIVAPSLNHPPQRNEMQNLNMNSMGPMGAPNVIVVDTRQLSAAEKKCTSVGVQANEAELLSKKQKKKLKKKEKKHLYAQQAEDTNTIKVQTKSVISHPETSMTPPLNLPRIPAVNMQYTQPVQRAQDDKLQKEKKKGKKKGKKDNWETIFAPKADLDLDGSELDDVERELEAFKRFCFNSVPPERKEKVKVNLNVKDIFVKKRTED